MAAKKELYFSIQCVDGTHQSKDPGKLEDDCEVKHNGNGTTATLCRVWLVTGKH